VCESAQDVPAETQNPHTRWGSGAWPKAQPVAGARPDPPQPPRHVLIVRAHFPTSAPGLPPGRQAQTRPHLNNQPNNRLPERALRLHEIRSRCVGSAFRASEPACWRGCHPCSPPDRSTLHGQALAPRNQSRGRRRSPGSRRVPQVLPTPEVIAVVRRHPPASELGRLRAGCVFGSRTGHRAKSARNVAVSRSDSPPRTDAFYGRRTPACGLRWTGSVTLGATAGYPAAWWTSADPARR
jgi:hypothetical protein